MTGYDAVKLFRRFGVFEYLDACYDVLHTTGRDYLIDDIDQFILVRS